MEADINADVHVQLDQGQFDALVAAGIQLGSQRLKSSQLMKKLNEGRYHDVFTELMTLARLAGKHGKTDLFTLHAGEAALFGDQANSTDEHKESVGPKASAASADKHPHEASGGDPVALARRFVGLPSWSPKLRAGLAPDYNNQGRQTNNCAEFVSAVLQKAGRISFHDPTVMGLESKLRGHGWMTVPKHQAKAGDVWLHEHKPQHVVLVSHDGGGSTIGADGGSQEIIKEEAMGYPGALYFHRT